MNELGARARNSRDSCEWLAPMGSVSLDPIRPDPIRCDLAARRSVAGQLAAQFVRLSESGGGDGAPRSCRIALMNGLGLRL